MKTPAIRTTRRRVNAALAALPLLAVGAISIGAMAQSTGTSTTPGAAAITPEMLRKVAPPPRPDATLRIEVKPGTAPNEERRTSAPQTQPAASTAPAPTQP